MGDIKVTFSKPRDVFRYEALLRRTLQNNGIQGYPWRHAIFDVNLTLLREGTLIPGARELVRSLRDATQLETVEVIGTRDYDLKIVQAEFTDLPIDNFSRTDFGKVDLAQRLGFLLVVEDGHGAFETGNIEIRCAEEENPLNYLVWTIGIPPRIAHYGYSTRVVEEIARNSLEVFRFLDQVLHGS